MFCVMVEQAVMLAALEDRSVTSSFRVTDNRVGTGQVAQDAGRRARPQDFGDQIGSLLNNFGLSQGLLLGRPTHHDGRAHHSLPDWGHLAHAKRVPRHAGRIRRQPRQRVHQPLQAAPQIQNLVQPAPYD